MSWPRQALIDLLGIEHPIIQAPSDPHPSCPEPLQCEMASN
jgi:hypothetical protein